MTCRTRGIYNEKAEAPRRVETARARERENGQRKGDAKMAYKIGDNCIKCGICAQECPVGAISEGEDKYVIDQDACLGCGTCADACPNGAITEEE